MDNKTLVFEIMQLAKELDIPTSDLVYACMTLVSEYGLQIATKNNLDLTEHGFSSELPTSEGISTVTITYISHDSLIMGTEEDTSVLH